MASLKEAISDLAEKNIGGLWILDGEEKPFKAITQTDLMEALRDRGWSLPAAGWFLGDVHNAGYKTKQGYQFKQKVRRYYVNGGSRKERSLSDYQTLILFE